ncbi:MAG: hypothetical protein AAFR23_04960 [Pseudomonadota bacterium]
MPQLIVLGAIGAAAYATYRVARRVRAAVTERAAQANDAKQSASPQNKGTLTRDPETGIYRPRSES